MKPIAGTSKLSLVKKVGKPSATAKASDSDSEVEVFSPTKRAREPSKEEITRDPKKTANQPTPPPQKKLIRGEENRFAVLGQMEEDNEMEEEALRAIQQFEKDRTALQQMRTAPQNETGRTPPQPGREQKTATTSAAATAAAASDQPVKKKERIPDIIIQGESVQGVIGLVKRSMKSSDFKIKIVNKNRFVLKMGSVALFKKILVILKAAKIQYYTYSLKSERPITLLLKGLHPDTEILDIKADIEATDRDLKVIKVKNFTTPKSVKGGYRLPMFLVQFESGTKIAKATAIRGVCNQIVKWSKMDKQVINQCHRCQGFGHSAANCELAFKCVKCAQNHEPGKCSISGDNPGDKAQLRCALCGEQGHPASYRGCKRFLQLKEKFRARNSQIKQVSARGGTITNRVATTFVNKNVSYANALAGHRQNINLPTQGNTQAPAPSATNILDPTIQQTMLEIKKVMLSLHKEVMDLKVAMIRETGRIDALFAMFESP